jgi:hypothetical protein
MELFGRFGDFWVIGPARKRLEMDCLIAYKHYNIDCLHNLFNSGPSFVFLYLSTLKCITVEGSNAPLAPGKHYSMDSLPNLFNIDPGFLSY